MSHKYLLDHRHYKSVSKIQQFLMTLVDAMYLKFIYIYASVLLSYKYRLNIPKYLVVANYVFITRHKLDWHHPACVVSIRTSEILC